MRKLRTFLKIRYGILLLIGILIAGVIIDDNTISVTEYTVASPRLPEPFDGYRIAVLSDYHNSGYYEQAAEKVKKAKPDLILFAGDIALMTDRFNANSDDLIRALKGTAPMYGILGNHDVNHVNRKKFESRYYELGLNLLNNAYAYVERDGEYLELYGVMDSGVPDSMLQDDPYYTDLMVPAAAAARNPNVFSILLNHRANTFEDFAETGYDLIVSGHMHGGVIRLPFIGGLFSSGFEQWFPPYTEGTFVKGDTTMVVSRGMDRHISKPRIFNGPEIVVITLKRK